MCPSDREILPYGKRSMPLAEKCLLCKEKVYISLWLVGELVVLMSLYIANCCIGGYGRRIWLPLDRGRLVCVG